MNIKTNKGITLIALVITIIVMLLMASVAIQMSLGKDGLITKANKARIEQARTELLEEGKMQALNYSLRNNLEGKNDNILNNLYTSKWFTEKYEIHDGNVNIYDKNLKENIITKIDFEESIKNKKDDSKNGKGTSVSQPSLIVANVKIDKITINDNIVKGIGQPLANITIRINGNEYYTTVDNSGRWNKNIPYQGSGTVISVEQNYKGIIRYDSINVIEESSGSGGNEFIGGNNEDDEGPSTVINP
jgi:hypothetical protein